MTDEKRTLLKLLSLCLAFPDAQTLEALPEMEAAAAGLNDRQARAHLSAFLARLRAQPLLNLQAHYTAAFDMNPAASLNLTYHLMGDREDRGRALAELLEAYRRDGFEPAVNELPDFLPLVLEFLTVSAAAEKKGLIRRCLTAIPIITGYLRESGSPYAVPLELLGGMVPQAGDVSMSSAGSSAAGDSGV
jgi:nitrate reductase delta subunit